MDYSGQIEEFAEKACFHYDLPGLAVGAWADEDSPAACAGTACAAVSGYLDFPEKRPIAADSLFHMASVSKLFVSTAVMLLAERGALDLEAPLAGYLPWLVMKDERFRDISARQALTHTAGFPDVLDYRWPEPEADSGALKRYLVSGEVRDAQLLWAPGEGRYRYSNLGYEILGALTAELSGVPFEVFVDENILKPLEMRDTTFLTWLRSAEGRAMDAESAGPETVKNALRLDALRDGGLCMPHRKDAGKHIIRREHFPYNRAHAPSSTLTSKLGDLRKFGDAHLHKKILRPESYEKLWTSCALVPNNGEHMGLGWFMRRQNSYGLYGHEGTDDGFRASFWICPELKLQIAVMSNLDDAPVKRINKQVFDMLT
ncbi:MAG: beta-lactamase family protein [Clostridiales Family XIII bacterium]|jgi:CubicO group peptidase (beta-lactamase class C family)|nr:beta-lactamase family protein [Clostridiales Family XIII bacterium]